MTVADRLAPFVSALLGDDSTCAIQCWDGSELGPDDAEVTFILRSARAVQRMMWAPGELGIARAFVAGDLDIEGDTDAFVAVGEQVATRMRQPAAVMRSFRELLRCGAQVGGLGLPPSPPPEEYHGRGRRHSRSRDAASVAHHYDVSSAFYRLFLGETMTYSCAYFREPGMTLDAAQEAKYDLICRKLGLAPGMRLLDVGCGWGGMVAHAATWYGVRAMGITASPTQAVLGPRRLADIGFEGTAHVHLADYRDVDDGPYDAISSIGMFEHAGAARLEEYLRKMFDLLEPGGRLLNHGISRPHRGRAGRGRTFIQRYVFPDGELHRVSDVASAMEDVGFEVRDVESLREHYVQTLREWVHRLELHWDEAVALVGEARARVWRLYMAGSARAFDTGAISVHQVLAVRPAATGASGMPSSREAWYQPAVSPSETRAGLAVS